MSEAFDTMMDPPVEELLERTGSKFALVALASRRARDINRYYSQLGDGLGMVPPPQVTSTASKSLSIAFEEIAADKIQPAELPSAEELAAAEAAAAADAAAAEAAAAEAPSTD
jgi:DNA-directed RNA polymerase subunit omega